MGGTVQLVRIKRLLNENAINPNAGKVIIGIRSCIERELQNNNRIYVCFRPANYRAFTEQYQYEMFNVEDMIGYVYSIDNHYITIAVSYNGFDNRIPELIQYPEQYVAEIISKVGDDGSLMKIIAVWIQRSVGGYVHESTN